MGRDRNRELIAEYPWLDIGNKQLTLLDALPVGWHDLILGMCKEIKQALPKELVNKYLSNGAQPSSRVVRILTNQGIEMPKWVKAYNEKHAVAKHADKLRKNQPKEEAEETAEEA